MKIEVCGAEVISLNKADQISEVYKRNSGNGIVLIDIDSLGYSFSSTRGNCPPSKFKIIEDSSEYQGSDLVLYDKGKKLLILTIEPINFSIRISGYSESEGSQASFPITILVCGYEKVEVRGEVQKIYPLNVGAGYQLIYQVYYQDHFQNNDT